MKKKTDKENTNTGQFNGKHLSKRHQIALQ